MIALLLSYKLLYKLSILSCIGQLSHSFLTLDQLSTFYRWPFEYCEISPRISLVGNFPQSPFLWHTVVLFHTATFLIYVNSFNFTFPASSGYFGTFPMVTRVNIPTVSQDSIWVPFKSLFGCYHFWFLCGTFLFVGQFPPWLSTFVISHIDLKLGDKEDKQAATFLWVNWMGISSNQSLTDWKKWCGWSLIMKHICYLPLFLLTVVMVTETWTAQLNIIYLNNKSII